MATGGEKKIPVQKIAEPPFPLPQKVNASHFSYNKTLERKTNSVMATTQKSRGSSVCSSTLEI